MGTSLCIQISSIHQPLKLEVEFFATTEWTSETEQLLMQKIGELLSVVRSNANSVKLNLDVEVNDPGEALFLVKKRMQHKNVFPAASQKLSIREMEILGFIMLGLTNQEIADKLFISFETVKSHRKHILTKTGAKNTAALIHFYHQTFFEK
jgi:DNA-binding CsgD family transcriptional regulator